MISKRRLSTTLGLAFGLLAAVAGAQGPVGQWPLDGDAVDISGNGLDGAIQGNVVATADRNAVSSAALEFGGTSADLVNVGDPAELQLTGAMTLAGWAYLDADSTNNARIIAKMAGGGSRSWSLCVEADFGGEGILNRGNFQLSPDGNSVVSLPTQGSVPTDEWFHLAGVYRPGEAMDIYLNGQLDDTLAAGIPTSQFSDNNQAVYIGNRVACGNCGWVGSLDDIRVYGRALNAAEILDLYTGVSTPTAPANLVAQPGDGAVQLTWDAASGVVEGYRVYQSQTSGSGYTLAATTTEITHTVTGLTNGTPYYFVVTAFNDAGEGPNSNEATATPQSGISLRAHRWDAYK
jgi:hypothetical protein